MPLNNAPLLEIEDLHTQVKLHQGTVHAVGGVSLYVEPGETLGLVGESGCGKTMTVLSVLGLLPVGGRVASGTIHLGGRQISGLSDREMCQIRGDEIGMIFQDPLTSLNPTMTVGKQIAEAVLLHRAVTKKAALERAAEVLGLVGLPKPHERLNEYPHQFSGGMRQRVMIAMALVCEPKLLIADEPTTAVDVTIQKQILELIDDLRLRLKMSVILVTHDLGVIAGRADRIAVMYAGKIVELASTTTLFANPQHPYTEALFQALPDNAAESRQRLYSIPGVPPDLMHPPPGCRFAPRCRYAQDRCRTEEPVLRGDNPAHTRACFFPVGNIERGVKIDRVNALADKDIAPAAANPVVLSVRELTKDFPVTRGLLQRQVGLVSAVSNVSFDIAKGETFGLVGESGCGKTSIGALIVGMEKATSGSIEFQGEDLIRANRQTKRRMRRKIQYMFQDSYASMNPRMRTGAIVREPLAIQRIGTRQTQRQRVAEMLDLVGLPSNAIERYPHEFSGGQRQRLGFARALIMQPDVIIADEPTSALDVSIQAQVLNLMQDMKRELGLTYLFISHDLAVVRYLSNHIGVMYLGKLVEIGPADDVFLTPVHPYSRGLIDSAPVADPVAEQAKAKAGVSGDLPSSLNPPSGCRFRTRCPVAQEVCSDVEPPLRLFSQTGHQAACHFPLRSPLPEPA